MKIINKNTKSMFLLSLILLGNTAGIWLTYLFVLLFSGFELKNPILFPGFMHFIKDGSLLLVTFSLLTTVIISSINKKIRLNWYNGFAILIFVFSVFIYGRIIGTNQNELNYWTMFVPFLLSVVLAFFTFRNQKRLFRSISWLGGSRSGNYDYTVFISFAIAAVKSKSRRAEIANEAEKLEALLSTLGYSPIFNASKHFSTDHDYQPPAVAAREDFSAIENCKNFLLYYPEAYPTSALIELGYALRDRDNIIICTKDKKHTLPFLARELSEINEKVKIIECESIQHLTDILRENHTEYLIK